MNQFNNRNLPTPRLKFLFVFPSIFMRILLLYLAGCCHRKPLLVPGGRAFVWPGIQYVQRWVLPGHTHVTWFHTISIVQSPPGILSPLGLPISIYFVGIGTYPAQYPRSDSTDSLSVFSNWWWWHRRQCCRISLNVMTLKVTSSLVNSVQGVPISVTGIAQVRQK